MGRSPQRVRQALAADLAAGADSLRVNDLDLLCRAARSADWEEQLGVRPVARAARHPALGTSAGAYFLDQAQVSVLCRKERAGIVRRVPITRAAIRAACQCWDRPRADGEATAVIVILSHNSYLRRSGCFPPGSGADGCAEPGHCHFSCVEDPPTTSSWPARTPGAAVPAGMPAPVESIPAGTAVPPVIPGVRRSSPAAVVFLMAAARLACGFRAGRMRPGPRRRTAAVDAAGGALAMCSERATHGASGWAVMKKFRCRGPGQ